MKYKDYLLESPQSTETARHLGLQYYSFGRWGKGGKVTHETHFGRLVPVKAPYSHKETGETALKHLEHAEDLPLNQGHEGVRHAMSTLLAAKHHDDAVHLTSKLDGSPSLITDTTTGKLSVATKSAFNKNPKINYTHADIEANHGHAPGLVDKMKQALDHLQKIGLHGKYQGDVLFGHDDKKIMDIDGTPHITFKPNTIRYAVPLHSEMGQKINRAKFGIALHSKYNEAGHLEPIMHDKFHEHPDVFVMPVEHVHEKHENPAFDDEMSKLGSLYRNIHPSTMSFISNPEYAPLFKQYINSQVRKGEGVKGSDSFLRWLHDYRKKDIDKLKTEKNQAEKMLALKKELDFFGNNAHHIDAGFSVISSIQRAKDHLISHFNKTTAIKHFVDTEHGLEPTNPEGFVATTAKGPVKLVQRSEFSRLNFQKSANR